MDDKQDPSALFFDGDDSVDLYAVLSLTSSASPDEIKKAYRKLALIYHPDKHATSDEKSKANASHKFQQVGFAYAVLSDEKRRKRYDKTGKTDEGFEDMGEAGWETYFEDLFDEVTKEKLDEMKKEYQGSEEEVEDLKKAYVECDGSLGEIMNHIPHSAFEDEARFIVTISGLISKGELSSLPAWESSSKDEKGKLVRKKQADKEAKEAEAMARELGVWDEFYGSGKKGERKGKAKGKDNAKQDADADDAEDHSALQALMLKRKKNMDGFFDNLAAKYTEPKGKGKAKGKKRKGAADGEEEEEVSPKKKRKGAAAEPPEIDDAEFEKLQQKLFGDKTRGSEAGSSAKTTKVAKAGRGRKGK